MITESVGIYISVLVAMVLVIRYLAGVIINQSRTITTQDNNQQGPIELARSALNIMSDVKGYISASTDALRAHDTKSEEQMKALNLALNSHSIQIEQHGGHLINLAQSMPTIIAEGIKPMLETQADGQQQLMNVLRGIETQLAVAQTQSGDAFRSIGTLLGLIKDQVLAGSPAITTTGNDPEGGESGEKAITPPVPEAYEVTTPIAPAR